MNLKSTLLLLFASTAISLGAAVPPAEQLLPAETVLMLTVPDWTKTAAAYVESPTGQLWRDSEMKAFREKFLNQLQNQVFAPLERELGIKWSDYVDLLRGQATLAILLKPGDSPSKPTPGWLMLLDAKDKGDQLKKNLADLKKKWLDSGKQVKSEKIRDFEFSTLVFTPDDFTKALRRAFQGDKGAEASAAPVKSDEKIEMTFGQVDSVLLVGSHTQDLEKVVVRLTAGQSSVLSDQADFQANQTLLRNALVFGWLNFQPVISVMNKIMTEATASGRAANPIMPKIDKVFSAVGLDGLKSLAGSLTANAEGEYVQLSLNVPSSGRKGLFKILTIESKDANPPPFVPSDVVKFNRWRMDGQNAWGTIESMVAEISPEINGIFQMYLGAAGKDKDPNFDLKKSLIANLGNDLIGYQKNPRGYTLAALNSPPSLFLVGSPKPDQLAQAIKTVAGMVIPATSIKERNFSGRKIFSFVLPSMPGPDAGAGEKSLQFSDSNGYLAITSDESMMEEYLRSNENKPKALAETTGLKEASEKVGGMATGLWGYENQGETMRALLETLKRDSGALEQMFNFSPLGPTAANAKAGFKNWVDLALLPPFERIAKYFTLTVYTGATTSEGWTLKFFSPTPPNLK